MIEVRKIDDTIFEVTVEQRVGTHHRVTLEPAYYERLTGGRVPPETLVQLSFEFLLKREPNTAILEQFDLTVINRYFPDYEQAIREELGS